MVTDELRRVAIKTSCTDERFRENSIKLPSGTRDLAKEYEWYKMLKTDLEETELLTEIIPEDRKGYYT